MINTRLLLCFMSLLAVAVLITAVSASASCVGATCPLGGNMRFQYGNGLPIPLTFIPAPDGKVAAVTSATVMVGTGAVPSLMLAPGQLFAPAAAPAFVLPVFLANTNVFQQQTAISASFPRVGATFKAGGRTGPEIASFCPGVNTATLFTCTATFGGSIPGRMRYTKTANQFGGPAQMRFGGSANIALRGAAPAPCTGPPSCVAVFARNTPPPTGAAGGPFGFVNSIALPASGVGTFFATVSANGFILGAPTKIGPGLDNPVASFGGPWTTGMITVSQPSAIGPGPEVFMLSGSDGRISGAGIISLVAGSLTQRTLLGPNANPAWLNLNVPEPSLSAMVGAGAALLVLASGSRLGRRGRR